MMNRKQRVGPADSLAIRLEGSAANRDAIGAVVELVVPEAEKTRRLVRSLRAGDLFLSQSSKWLHFGIAGAGEIAAADVLWPGGQRERFAGLANGGRFLLRQGTGKASPWHPQVQRKQSVLPDQVDEKLVATKDHGIARIILPGRVPMPAITFRDQAARAAALTRDGKPRLLVLW